MTTNSKGKRRANMRSLSIVLLILTGCAAIFAGFSFIADPSGAGLGMREDELGTTPFSDYMVPGILLLFFNGILNIGCAVFAMLRFRQTAVFLSFQGWVMVIWILVQVAMLQRLNPLHLICLAIGIAWLYTGNLLLAHNRMERQT